jgi:hypothetical protein
MHRRDELNLSVSGLQPRPTEPAQGTSPTWLQWPTIVPQDSGRLPATEARFHSGTVVKLARRWGPIVTASLGVESEGEHSVQVLVGGQLVANVPHEHFEEFRELVQEIDGEGQAATCRIQLEVAEEWTEVWLPAKPQRRGAESPFFIGMGGGGARVVLDWGEKAKLEKSLKSRAKTKTVARLGTLNHVGEAWRVQIGDDEIGTLEAPYGFRFRYVEAAQAAGFPLTCTVTMKRRPDHPFLVWADVPPPS